MKKSLLFLATLMTVSFVLLGCPGDPPQPPPETTTPPVVTTRDTTGNVEPERPTVADTLRTEQLATVYFDYDKYNLRSDAKSALDANYELLKQFSKVTVKIEGHCDERGTIEYNLVLGEKRARATMEYLTGLGIDPARLSIISYGKERPATMGANEEAWSRNRRAEFKIVSQ